MSTHYIHPRKENIYGKNIWKRTIYSQLNNKDDNMTPMDTKTNSYSIA